MQHLGMPVAWLPMSVVSLQQSPRQISGQVALGFSQAGQRPTLLDAANGSIEQGAAATHAWHDAIQAQCAALLSLAKPLFAERTNDLWDLQQGVLRVLLGEDWQFDLPRGAIVAAHELTPSDLLQLSAQQVAGLCLAEVAPLPMWRSWRGARACRAWWHWVRRSSIYRRARRWCWPLPRVALSEHLTPSASSRSAYSATPSNNAARHNRPTPTRPPPPVMV